MRSRSGIWQMSLTIAALLLLCGAANQATATSILQNGDFELGTAFWDTDYIKSSDLFPSGGLFEVTLNPAFVHPLAASYGDHTSGSGLMLIVNGATVPGQIVWEQTVSGVNTSLPYRFSGWVSTWFPVSPANLQVLINGTPIGTFLAPASTALWQQFEALWMPDSSTATIKIIDLNVDSGGNDFALDDLAFVEVPEPSTALFLGFGLLGLGVYALGRKKRA